LDMARGAAAAARSRATRTTGCIAFKSIEVGVSHALPVIRVCTCHFLQFFLRSL
jgi:hypothetical protein